MILLASFGSTRKLFGSTKNQRSGRACPIRPSNRYPEDSIAACISPGVMRPGFWSCQMMEHGSASMSVLLRDAESWNPNVEGIAQRGTNLQLKLRRRVRRQRKVDLDHALNVVRSRAGI
jgi:hypothetical protein